MEFTGSDETLSAIFLSIVWRFLWQYKDAPSSKEKQTSKFNIWKCEICDLLGSYAAYSGSFHTDVSGPVPSSKTKKIYLPLKIRQIGYPETSI